LKINSTIYITILFILLSLLPCRADEYSQSTLTMETDGFEGAMLNKALTLVYSDSFEAAISCVDSLIEKNNRFWPAYVIKAGIIYTRMTDDERYDSEECFKALIDTSIAGLDDCLEENPDDKWAMFFKGTALGYLAVWEGHHGSWFSAVVKGVKAGKLFSKAVKRDSLFYEAYLGLGTLHYWRAAKIGIIRKLPFVADTREQGIEELKLAVENSHLSSTAAALGLAWVYIDRKDYQKTIEVTDRLIDEGLTGRQVLWPKAIAEFNKGNARGTIENFTLIRDGLIRKGNQNYQNLVICNYCLGKAHYWKGDYRKAMEYFDEILSYELSPKVAKKVSKKLKDTKKYKKKITERIRKASEKSKD